MPRILVKVNITWLLGSTSSAPITVAAAKAAVPAGPRANRRHRAGRPRHQPSAATVPPTGGTVPPAETRARPSVVPPPTPTLVDPSRAPERPAVEADGHGGECGPPSAKMSDRDARAHSGEAAGDIAATPPAGADGSEGQDGRTDKERKGGRRKYDERWRCRNDDSGGGRTTIGGGVAAPISAPVDMGGGAAGAGSARQPPTVARQ